MSSKSPRPTIRSNLSLDDKIDRPVGGDASDGRAAPFARAKFLWLDQICADPELTPLAFMLAYVLANLVNEREGYAWPSVAHLASKCRVTENGVKKVVRRLAERGHLSVEFGTGRGKTNRYRWIVKEANARSVPEKQREHLTPSFDRIERRALPFSDEKGATAIAPIDEKRGNPGSGKGQLAFQKRAPPVAPTLFKESIYDPLYRLSSQHAANARRVITKMIALLDNSEEVLIATGDLDESKKALPT